MYCILHVMINKLKCRIPIGYNFVILKQKSVFNIGYRVLSLGIFPDGIIHFILTCHLSNLIIILRTCIDCRLLQINKKNIGNIVICVTISCVPVSVIIYCSHITLSSINIALVSWFHRWKFILNSIPILYTDRYVSFSAGRFVNVCSLTKCPRGKILVDCINYSQIYFTRTVKSIDTL